MNTAGMSDKDLRSIIAHPEHFAPEDVEAAKRQLNMSMGQIYRQIENQPSKSENKDVFKSKQIFGTIIFACILCFIFYSLGFFSKPRSFQTSEKIKTNSQSHAQIGSVARITKDGWFGCVNEEDLNKVLDYSRQGDKEAFNKAFTLLLLNDLATSFKFNESVYVVDRNSWRGMIKIRRKGSIAEYWSVDAIVE